MLFVLKKPGGGGRVGAGIRIGIRWTAHLARRERQKVKIIKAGNNKRLLCLAGKIETMALSIFRVITIFHWSKKTRICHG